MQTDFNKFDTMSFASSLNQPEMGTSHRAQNRLANLPPLQICTEAAASTIFSSEELAIESIMPGIYLTKNFIVWNKQNLQAHGFTHIIIIDKHIQELYYPSPVFKLASLSPSSDYDVNVNTFDYFPLPLQQDGQRRLSFGQDFEAIDLNFGEKSYLTTVLPNCYKAVRFINKAIQAGGTILVIDCNGGEQKCVTIIVAYLMYKYNISFGAAFERLKKYYNKADLDRFYTSQLYEYEPILQVQRAQSRGQSCSREMHSAILKRKKNEDETEFFDNLLNPLSQFKVNVQEVRQSETSAVFASNMHDCEMN